MKTFLIILIALIGSGIFLTKSPADTENSQKEIVVRDIEPGNGQVFVVNAEMETIKVFDEQELISNQLSVDELHYMQNADFLVSTMGNAYYLAQE